MKQPKKCTLVGGPAWETISDCVKNAKEKMLIDHTCLVLPGRYQERIPIDGTEGLTIRGVYGEEKPIIDGTVELHPRMEFGQISRLLMTEIHCQLMMTRNT